MILLIIDLVIRYRG